MAQIVLLVYLAFASVSLLIGVVAYELKEGNGLGFMVLVSWAILIMLIVLAGGFSHFSIN